MSTPSVIDRHNLHASFPTRAFIRTMLVNTVWINASEILRYFLVVRCLMREALPQVTDVVPMNLPVFAIWGVWDTILVACVTGFVWIYLERFGGGVRNAIVAGSLFWIGVFVILWVGILNMNLATAHVLVVALPLAWVEMVVAALIVNWGMRRFAAATGQFQRVSAVAQ
jgi:hypothetical protein